MSAQLQRSAILAALIEAGPDGLSESDMPRLGGMWWQERIRELARHHVIGWDMVDGEKRYFLANGVEQADRAGTVKSPPVEGAVGLLNTESDTLFRLPARSAYEIDREAA